MIKGCCGARLFFFVNLFHGNINSDFLLFIFFIIFFFFSICLLACVSPGNHCNNGNHRNILKANFNDACELLSRCLNTAGGKHNQQKDLGFIYATGGVPVVFLCEECSSVQVRKTTVFSSGDGE